MLIKARMQTGARWGDVCLLNMSSRGALVQSAEPSPQGAYIEVRRGHHVIVARVMWIEGHRFGIYAQDTIAIDQIVSEREGSKKLAQVTRAPQVVDRRETTRKPDYGARHEASRIIGRSIEFCFVIGIGASLAVAAFSTLRAAVMAPMSRLSTALEPSQNHTFP